jgi:hypothetical protein
VLTLLAVRNFLYKPWRAALLFVGFGLGVAVMIVLLSIGAAMVTQAQDAKLVGGGDVTILPDGIDMEVMKTGGLGGLFFSIPNARFVYLQLLAAPRLASLVRAVAPQSDGKLLYLTTADGVEWPVRALGEIPSATAAVGAAPPLAAGSWGDDDGDRRWAHPTAAELEADIDHFHTPAPALANRNSWAEWHYFNIVSPDRRRWVFISFILAGDVSHGQWGGEVLVTTHAAPSVGAPAREHRYVASARPDEVRYSTTSPDLQIGTSSVELLSDGRYAVRAHGHDENGRAVDVDLVITPAPRAYFPGVDIATGDFASGYSVPALKANGSGSVCEGTRCAVYRSAQAYHDHNWGVWRGVTWDWGAARAGNYAFLFGRVQPPDSLGGASPLFLYLVDSLGFRAVFRPAAVTSVDDRIIEVDGHRVRVPSTERFADVRDGDTVRVQFTVEDAVGTDTRQPLVERGAAAAARRLVHPYFVQMKGHVRLSGRIDGAPMAGDGTGFFETYR